MYRRYAIYVTPCGPLGDHGAAWLGWDIMAGRRVAHPQIDGLDVAKITTRPRKYGLHATIKPPMVLAAGSSQSDVVATAQALAQGLAPVTMDRLKITKMGRFLALTPEGDTDALNALAAKVVRSLDPHRAPATSEETARRRKHGLTPSQEQNLVRWGYPHVMEDFHFHITLTGPLRDAQTVLPHAAFYFASVLSQPFFIDHLTLAGEDADGMFHSIARLPLAGLAP